MLASAYWTSLLFYRCLVHGYNKTLIFVAQRGTRFFGYDNVGHGLILLCSSPSQRSRWTLLSRIARPAALVAGFEGGHSETSKHIFCVNLAAMALACAAQWFGGWLSWRGWNTRKGRLCLAAPPRRARRRVTRRKVEIKKSLGGFAAVFCLSARQNKRRRVPL